MVNQTKVSDHLLSNYADYYEEGDSAWRWLGAIDKAENIVSLCNNLPHASVIDIGAGEGSVLKRLEELNFGQQLYALEISPTGIETIKNKGISRLTECSLYDGYNIPYEDVKFDLAVLSHVIEHVEYPRKLIDEARRIAKYVYVEVPLEDTARLPQDFIFDKVGHINFYSPKTIRRLVQTCHLKVLNQHTVNPSKSLYTFQKGKKGLIDYYIKEFALKLFPSLATSFFTYHSALVCQRIDSK
ncbi:MAG: class I SAM-dependent methyltransferase [Zetaproteobacteria bacterium CG12_big_fil_rev_8_21_14_0_65_55_1124]|nr:MAG: hypothetical protein AUJ58_08495 [Zetaproteobacteria bacterium CG1_02_55_237]PIS19701.1 MAG: class I SAM-dependent methyltransferase [Zetaproteobacteria bacterium CG08_land_8_20_14_0_20_55_17]PIW43468.1 MAG: class I SAM-dependent methyltransferase [Zetaproteobacteria bacterium CG12_big_fil_rev_8_21_14_0_65_55_1124]PIY54099.1 MAG: class I SAM-dependent methyltransferase [Zetaproteobacteria bacterium CG_4_10_14_0_8_um_filter_55_43]PIZ39092.1 MAG: class I SAM-dependent methyltransferase [Z